MLRGCPRAVCGRPFDRVCELHQRTLCPGEGRSGVFDTIVEVGGAGRRSGIHVGQRPAGLMQSMLAPGLLDRHEPEEGVRRSQLDTRLRAGHRDDGRHATLRRGVCRLESAWPGALRGGGTGDGADGIGPRPRRAHRHGRHTERPRHGRRLDRRDRGRWLDDRAPPRPRRQDCLYQCARQRRRNWDPRGGRTRR